MIGTVATLMFLPVVFSVVHAWLAKRSPHGMTQAELDILK
jgi:hypothetical protein